MKEFLDDLPDLGLPAERRHSGESKGVPTQRCVVWWRPRCPYCGSADVPVTNSNHVPYRYHHCRSCGKNFPSWEKNATSSESSPSPQG